MGHVSVLNENCSDPVGKIRKEQVDSMLGGRLHFPGRGPENCLAQFKCVILGDDLVSPLFPRGHLPQGASEQTQFLKSKGHGDPSTKDNMRKMLFGIDRCADVTTTTSRLPLNQSYDLTTLVDPSYNQCKMPHEGDELLARSQLHNVRLHRLVDETSSW
jgi:hypothetical protein